MYAGIQALQLYLNAGSLDWTRLIRADNENPSIGRGPGTFSDASINDKP